ncbi:MAG: hypothetical protein Q8Q42_03590 [Nanoarchaeota archaeon]|nr:hypothetical protein [Nanoarchaeota archaeon]
MKILKSSWKTYKKNIIVLNIIQLALFISSMFFLIYSKNNLAAYLQRIQEFQPALQQAIAIVDKTNPETIAYSASVVEAINSITQEAMFFALVIVPIGLLILWTVFQGLFWSKIKDKKINEKFSYFLKLGIPTAAIILLIINFVAFPKDITQFFSTFYDSTARLVIISFITLYIFTVYNTELDNKKIKDVIKRTFRLSVKKFYKFIPLYIPLYLNSLVMAWLLSIWLTQAITGSYIYLSITQLIIYIIITINVSVFYKILFQKVADKS